ncbi:MAG: glutaconate CoA-transferase [Clostridiales Family XIII bacterium]|jgi:glutaconate CoA-transferase subunit A|nr:glutaconate CoA-transferase [Clostridiales Family XIII bacterium]
MNKKMTLRDAVAQFVRDGDQLAIGGFTTNRKPFALVHEILRQGRTGFIGQGGPAGGDFDLLIGEGRLAAYVNSYTANSGFSNVSRRFRHAVQAGLLPCEDYSLDVQVLLFSGAALGLPYVPVRAMLGSDLLAKWGISREQRRAIGKLPDEKYILSENPFSQGEKLVLVPTPQLDLALLHVQMASPDGTCRIEGDPFHDIDIAIAARRVIASCETLVSDDEIRREPERNSIPGFAVDAVVHAPYGAHPSQCYGHYDYDAALYREYDEASRTDEGFRAYVEKWVYGPEDHADYLDLVGASRLMDIKAVPGLGFAPAPTPTPVPTPTPRRELR